MKAALLAVANVIAVLWQVLPTGLRRAIIKGLLVLESRGTDSARGLRRLFAIQDALNHVVAERAMALGRGIHPKHRLTRYHDFFIERIRDGEAVIDIGCGYGAVARSVAAARPGSRVLGVDYDDGRLAQAKSHPDTPSNLGFVKTDATVSVPDGPWDVVILSNVLEHIRDRPRFLRKLVATTQARRFLIRVPHFERDWTMPMRRELGVNYYSDDDHKIEHTKAEFLAEMVAAGLRPAELMTVWGEIWSALEVETTSRV
ncbi:MAG: class I SAM-dependent methyltransferase [Hyphomicrobiaceae bacterium]